jgi:hypothetical protein
LWASQVYRITVCRLGNEKTWQELAPANGPIVAGPYFDFVIPAALQLLGRANRPMATGRRITFATNAQREIAVLLGDSEALPPLPDSFGVIAPPQPMHTPRQPMRMSESWWKRLFSR